MEQIIAVDFDGTLNVKNVFPEVGEPNTELINELIRMRGDGVKVILNTCRSERRLTEAVEFCGRHGLEFDAVNENLSSSIEAFGGDTRKIVASVYIDDRAVTPNEFMASVGKTKDKGERTMPIKEGRQYRTLSDAVTASENENEYTVVGYAMKYERYLLYTDSQKGDIYERFEPSAFASCDLSDVIVQYDHCGHVLARISNGTLKLTFDEIGLRCEMLLSGSEASRELYREIKAGLVTRMSWSFLPDKPRFDRESRTIVHGSVKKIYDVSAVSIPANNETELYARSLCDGAIAQALEECRKRDKIKLQIKTKIGGII